MKKILFALAMLYAGLFANMYGRELEEKADAHITPKQYQSMLGCGLNVDWSKTKKGTEGYSEQAVKDFAQRGFSHVRIRVKDDISEDLLNTLSEQVNECLKNGVIPVIAYQAKNFKLEPSEKNLRKTVDWWQKTADHFKNYSDSLSFDILIECTDKLNKNQHMLDLMFEETVSAIRESNPHRIIFITPRVRSAPENLNELKIPSKSNGYLMAESHFYASGPSKTNSNKLWTTGTDAEKKIITDKIECALKWSEKSGIPIWIGAWMPGDFNRENEYSPNEQAQFAGFVSSALNAKNIPFAVNEGSKYYDYQNKEWIDNMKSVVDSIVR